MPALMPKNQTDATRAALFAMLPAHEQVRAHARDDLLARLNRCGTETDAEETFDVALIEEGGTHIWPQPTGRPGNHEHEVSVLGGYGIGPTYAAAIASWRKSARRMLSGGTTAGGIGAAAKDPR